MMCPSSDDAKGTLEAVVLFSEAGEFHSLGLYAVEEDLDEGWVVAGMWEFGFLRLIGVLVCQEHGTIATEEPLQGHLGAVFGNGHWYSPSLHLRHEVGHGALWYAYFPGQFVLRLVLQRIGCDPFNYCFLELVVSHILNILTY